MGTPDLLPGPAARHDWGPRYAPGPVLGSGAMGTVYRVRDTELNKQVALKAIKERDPDELFHLKQEFRALCGVRHPNLVELYELGAVDDRCFFTMELVDDARDFLGDVRPTRNDDLTQLPPDRFARFQSNVVQLARSVRALHAAGWVHRDVKPPNVLVDRGGRVTLLDFGLTRPLAPTFADGGELSGGSGTPRYMAPEQLRQAPLTPASDWYSVGLLLYEALTGQLPHADRGVQRMLWSRYEGHAPRPPSERVEDVPAWLDGLVCDLLAPEPERRPAGDDVLARISATLGAGTTPSVTSRRSAHAAHFVGREQEQALLRDAFATVDSERGCAVAHVAGASGMGKSALVERFASDLEHGGRALVLRGRCHPQELVPFKALDRLVDELSRYLRRLDMSSGVPIPEHVTDLLRLFPVLRRVGALANAGSTDETVGDPVTRRRRGARALRWLIARVSERLPVVAWIDDLQWGDTDSLFLLRELLTGPDPPRVLLVLSYRSED
ncbi:serine/threonine-protein kinase, partial [Planctomycetota bacterium]|nr:serine/threonine-protein kinase [Planctomycetota bacterium]